MFQTTHRLDDVVFKPVPIAGYKPFGHREYASYISYTYTTIITNPWQIIRSDLSHWSDLINGRILRFDLFDLFDLGVVDYA